MSEAATPDALLAFVMEAGSDADPGDPALQVFAELAETSPESLLAGFGEAMPGTPCGLPSGIHQSEPAPNVIRLSAALKVTDKGDGRALMVLDLPKAKSHTSPGSENARALRLLPQFVLAFEEESNAAAPMALSILAHEKWDSPMCALSLEDAVLLEGLRAETHADAPERSGIFPARKGLYPMPPGTGAVLLVKAPRNAVSPKRIAKILRRSAAILLRRLDIARARAHECAELEKKLLDGA